MSACRLELDAAQAALRRHRAAFDTFSQQLIECNKTTNLTRLTTVEAIALRHFLDALAALPVLDAAAANRETFSLIDIGSGAGFPALAIAIARPQWRIVSLEATDKKVQFQRQICKTLGLGNVDVLHGRAEMAAHRTALREGFDAATARAVAPLAMLAELAMAFVRPQGLGLFWKGSQVEQELAAAVPSFGRMGASLTSLWTYTLPPQADDVDDAAFYLVAAQKCDAAPAAYPRQNFAAIKKRPLR